MGNWTVKRGGRGRLQVQAYYGDSENPAQYVALHTASGYLRLVPSTDSSWGTSIVIVPALWSNGTYHQGSRCATDWHISGDDLVLTVATRIKTLRVRLTLRIEPPTPDRICSHVSAAAVGEIKVDTRSGESFKPVALSSMHTSDASFDTVAAFSEQKIYKIESGPWIIPPEPTQFAKAFGLIGGTSNWKANAPTVAIELNHPLQVAGWKTQSTNPNDDNIGLWAASPNLLREWSYKIITTPVYPKNQQLALEERWW